jgi:hypothetical protein
MSNKFTFQFSKEEKQPIPDMTRDQVLQMLNKQMKTFASINGITDDEAQELLAKAESSPCALKSKETDFFKFNDLVFKIAQEMLDNKDAHIDAASTAPSTPINKTRRESV